MTQPDDEKSKRTPDADAYDRWFREQVQAALDDPRPCLTDEEMKVEFAARREAVRRRAEGRA